MSTVVAPATGALISPVGLTRLVGSTGDKQPAFTANQETDARGALTRGLAEYIAPLSGVAFGGRKVRFKNVYDEFSEPEDHAEYPSVVITLQGPGVYEARTLAPTLDPLERIPPPDGRYLMVFADFVQDVSVECWCNSPEERMSVTALLERSFNPWPNKYGFNLEFPHYFNVRGSYSMTNLLISDTGDDANRRIRIAAFTLSCRVPLVSLFSFPDARPSFDLQAAGSDPDMLFKIAVS